MFLNDIKGRSWNTSLTAIVQCLLNYNLCKVKLKKMKEWKKKRNEETGKISLVVFIPLGNMKLAKRFLICN